MNDGVRIVFFEIALERPIMRETEGKQRLGSLHRLERDDVSAVVGAADAHERVARDRAEIGELDRVAGFGPDRYI